MRRFGTLPTKINASIISRPPSPKSNDICVECPMLLKRINDLSVLLHNSEEENKEMYSQLNSQIQSQYELNHQLINQIETMQKNYEDKERIEKHMKEKEEKIEELEKLPPTQTEPPPKSNLPRVAQLPPKKKISTFQ